MTLLVVTAVQAELDAVRDGLDRVADSVRPPVRTEAVGVGPAAAAARTARLLTLAEAAGQAYQAVVCAGIGGGVAGRCAIGGTVLAARCVAADLGAESPDGFLPLDQLGFGTTVVDTDPGLLRRLRHALPHALAGDILTVSTVTGTARSTEALVDRHPDALAEGMEGYGVACAARDAGVPFAEVRTVSNVIGPRDRAAWRIGQALAALADAAEAVALATVRA